MDDKSPGKTKKVVPQRRSPDKKENYKLVQGDRVTKSWMTSEVWWKDVWSFFQNNLHFQITAKSDPDGVGIRGQYKMHKKGKFACGPNQKVAWI